jgi:hypothetical protein
MEVTRNLGQYANGKLQVVGALEPHPCAFSTIQLDCTTL